MPNNVQEFISTVCNQVRFKRAHKRITCEMTDHIADQTQAFAAEGLSPDDAEQKAIAEMGDPIMVGQQLDKEYRPKPPYLLFAGILSLLALGIGLRALSGDPLNPQDIFAIGLAIVAFGGAYLLDFTWLAKPWVCWTAVGIVFALCLFANRIFNGQEVLHFGIYSLPLFFLVILLLPVLASLIWQYGNKGTKGLAIVMAVIVITFTASARSGFSFSVIYCLAAVALVAYAIFSGIFKGKKWLNSLLLLSPLSLFLYFYLLSPSYFMNRLVGAFAPQADAHRWGYVALTVQQGLADAGLWSGGQSETLASFSHHPDLLFSTIINQYGWALALLAIGLIGVFFAILIKYCLKQTNRLSRLIALSVSLAFFCQALIYIVFNLGFTLIAPVPLPFLTPGNSSLVVNALLMGLLASALRTGHMVECPVKTKQTE